MMAFIGGGSGAVVVVVVDIVVVVIGVVSIGCAVKISISSFKWSLLESLNWRSL